jgi:PD-(D/E)XK nuclease superfamily protein
LDLGGKFVRAQCKTGRLRHGVILFNTFSVQSNTHRSLTRNYVGEADLFLVYCPDTTRIYAVLVAEATAAYMSLRVDPTLNNQERGIRWARDYDLPE